jgi:hypothetical protein
MRWASCALALLAGLAAFAGRAHAAADAAAEPPAVEAPALDIDSSAEVGEDVQLEGDTQARQERRASGDTPPLDPSLADDFPGPHGAIEFGLGILALPDAQVCSDSSCDRGDVSLEVDAWPLFRASPSFAVGAGLTLALLPIQNAPARATDTPRDSSRSYFMAEGMGRYYFTYSPKFEAWVGLSAGLVVVSENFRTNTETSEIALIASKGANIATEGLSAGLAAGLAFRTSRQLAFGGMLRVTNWFLPEVPEQIAFGDKASLAGRITMINLAISVSYASRL